MSEKQRRKGRDGQSRFKAVLSGRDWTVAGLESGTATEDILAVDSDGNTWSVEVKTTKAIDIAHRRQAMDQAKKRKLPWMLASHIEGTSSWLVQRQGRYPCVWHERDKHENC